ncbi:MAG: hypothetical protein ACD_46C00181G0021 [uncultured bacterium]|nr:MAG: hypothetical protein ACD_46C00181G0021 [uncultured bacterium]
MTKSYIISANNLWQPKIIENLTRKIPGEFILIEDKKQLTFDFIKKINPQFIFFTHWSYYISQEIYEKFECIVFHMTDLPFGRGGSPLQNLISRGIQETKLSAIKCVEEIDAGPIYLKYPLSLLGTAQEIFENANSIMEDMIVEIIKKKPTPQPQNGEPVYFTRRKPEEGNIANLDDLEKIYDYIRMLDANNYPHAFIETDFLHFEFTQATLLQGELIANVKITKKKNSKNSGSDSCSS